MNHSNIKRMGSDSWDQHLKATSADSVTCSAFSSGFFFPKARVNLAQAELKEWKAKTKGRKTANAMISNQESGKMRITTAMGRESSARTIQMAHWTPSMGVMENALPPTKTMAI